MAQVLLTVELNCFAILKYNFMHVLKGTWIEKK